jgi:hypothetical protein
VQDSTADGIERTAELPFAAALVLPAAGKEAHRDRWHASNHLISISSTILESAWQPTHPPEFAPPAHASLLVRPNAARVRPSDPAQCLQGHAGVYRAISPVPGNIISPSRTPRPQAASTPPIPPAAQQPEMRAIKTAALFLGPLETRPLRQKAVFRDPSVSAMESGWRASLAKAPLSEPLSTATWQRQAHCVLPVSITDGPLWSTVPMQLLPYEPACIQQGPAQLQPPSLAGRPYQFVAWRSIGPAVPRRHPPAPFAALPELRFSAVDSSSITTKLSTGGAALVALPDPFAAVSSTVFSQPDVRFMTSTNFPRAVSSDAWAGFGTVQLCTPQVSWGPRRAAARNPRTVKFLPRREDPILPTASDWARLRSLPR